MTPLGERPVSSQAIVEVRFGNVKQLFACHVRPVERDTFIRAFHAFTNASADSSAESSFLMNDVP
jgi:hypothetical protein